MFCKRYMYFLIAKNYQNTFKVKFFDTVLHTERCKTLTSLIFQNGGHPQCMRKAEQLSQPKYKRYDCYNVSNMYQID